MNKHRKFQTAASLGAGLLLLSTALTAWGVSIILTGDAGGTVSCTTSLVTVTDGNVTAEVPTACIPGGDPPPPGSFTLSVSKTGSGTVTSSPPGINCGTTCSTAFSDGTAVALTAAPAAGSSFTGWGGACSGTGTCNLSMTASRSVTATFTADSGGGDCGALPPDVVVVDTGNMTSAFAKQTYTPASPSTIYAFKVRINAGYTGNSAAGATKDVSSDRTKRLVVSTCPGVLTPVNGQGACNVGGQNVATVRMSGNQSAPSYVCKLPNSTTTDYYVNAVSKENLSDTGFSCTSSFNCAFAFDRSGGG